MSLFAWANKQLETLSDKLAPVPNDTAHRFYKACSTNDTHLALQLISQTPPPMPDGTFASPLDVFNSLISSKGTLPLHCAAVYAQTQVVQTLIAQYGVPPEQLDPKGNTPLHYAALSTSPAALPLVKMLVNDYRVSVTVKNVDGRTPYDVASQDSIRQYLLPIQLQRETQECIDNGGQGLPQGIDMGGLTIKRDIAPPPIRGFGSPPPGAGASAGVNSYSAASLGTASKYAVPTFGNESSQPQPQPHPAAPQPQPLPHQPVVSPMANNYGYGGYGAPQPTAMPMANNTSFHSPVAAASPPGAAGAVASGVPSATIANAFSSPPIVSEPNVPVQPEPAVTSAPVDTTTATNPTADATATPAATSPVAQEPAPVATMASVDSSVNAPSTDATPSTAPVAVPDATPTPTYEAKGPSTTSAPTPNAMPSNPGPGSFSAPSTGAHDTSTTTMPATVSKGSVTAPSSGSSASYARRGFSSAAVLPSKSKYKPDGFHSSSSDVSLQQKYGHDSSITGPPSGQFAATTIAPPPLSGGSSGPNPYASLGGLRSHARPRYPTYDAVSGTVGAALGGGGGSMGYQNHHYNAAAAAPIPQYNTYTPQNHYQQQQQHQQPAYDYSQQQATGYANQYQEQQQQQQQPAYDYNQQMQYQQPQQQTYDYNQQQQYQQQQQQPQQYGSTYEQQQQVSYQQNNAAVSQPSVVQSNTTTTTQPAVNSADVPVEETTAAAAAQPAAATPVAAQSSQAFFNTPQSVETTPAPAPFQPTAVVGVSEQMQNLSVGKEQPERQTSATELFGSTPSAFHAVSDVPPTTTPATSVDNSGVYATAVAVEPNVNADSTSASELFGSHPQPVPVMAEASPSVGEKDGDSDDLPPPPFVSENTMMSNNVGDATESDDFLPPPPFGVVAESSENVDLSGDDLPPPPMMDISLS